LIERIAQLREEAEAAIGAVSDSAALEELRVRYLGRKAELPNLLRGVADLPPEQRGQVGKAANEAQGELEELIAARRVSANSPLADLTPRELDVLREMAQGKTNAAIGSELSLSESAVENTSTPSSRNSGSPKNAP
jgi:DNA-binding NarL/FixJ family response regulator